MQEIEMTKRASLLLATAVVVAFAVPAMAHAAPELTSKAGTTAPTATELVAKSSNTFSVETGSGTVTCTFADFNWDVLANGGSKLTGFGTGQGTLTFCELAKKSVLGTDFTVGGITSTVVEKGTVKMSFDLELPGPIFCHFTAELAPFTYSSGSSFMKLKGADFISSPASCEPGLVSAEFLTTLKSGGTNAIWD